MADERAERRLAAILVADVVGYSSLIRADEEGTRWAVRRHNTVTIEPQVAAHRGRIFKTVGDGLLAEFASVVDAVRCAVEIQNAIREHNADVVAEKRIEFRIGVNLGDVIAEGDDLHGDGVNVAARLEGLAEPQGICISGSAFEQVRDKLEVGFEDLGDQQVKNIDRPIRAYRILMDAVTPGRVVVAMSAKLQRWKWSAVTAVVALVTLLAAGHFDVFPIRSKSPTVEQTSVERLAHPSPAKPSIAVLPFANMSDDKEQEYFSDGLTGDLITDLSRISGLTVIARTSTFAYKGQSEDVRTIGRELGARYVVEGSVRKIGGQVRITTQLIDTETGNHIWADRFDRSIADLFVLQDEVREKIIQALKVKLSSREKRWLTRRLTESPEAYDLYLQGLQQESYFTREGSLESRHLFQRAIELDPTFAAAYAHLAQAYSLAQENGWTDKRDEYAEKALTLAKKAVKLDDELPQAHWSLGRAYSRAPLRDHERAIAELKRVVTLDPNYADGYAFLASSLNATGRAEEALGVIEKAMRINPRFPFWYLFILGRSQFFLTHFEAAAKNFRKAIERNQTVPWPHRLLIATYGHLGMQDEAEWEISELEGLGQAITIKQAREATVVTDPAYMKLYLDGLRKAGVPEE